jgi:hypothetical protein
VGLDSVQAAIAPVREALLRHPIYNDLGHAQALRVFMQHHVFAVWDFMSLLKALQRQLCCVTIPWIPSEASLGGRLINEIVLAEESDEDGHGGFASHYELYHQAMRNFGADTSAIDNFLAQLRAGQSVMAAMQTAGIVPAIQEFVGRTFATIDSGDVCRVAATFTFGREDLLPAVFQKIVDEIAGRVGHDLDEFRYYLLRHVELDGDEHGPMANRLIESLCEADAGRWQIVEQAAVSALESRLTFWNAIHQAVINAD